MKINTNILPLSLVTAIALPVGALLAQDTDGAKPEAKPKCEQCEGCKVGDKSRPDAAERFAGMDTDKDGKITEAEVVASHQKRVAEFAKKHFTSMDLDENGFVTETEMKIVTSRSNSGRGHGGSHASHRGPGGKHASHHGGGGPRGERASHHGSRGGRDYHRGPGCQCEKGGKGMHRKGDDKKRGPAIKDVKPESAPKVEPKKEAPKAPASA